MEFEEIENGFKATVPLITEEELNMIDNIDNNDFDGIVDRFSKMIIKEKDLAIAQYIIKQQQKHMEELIRDSIPKKKVKDKLKQLNSEMNYCGVARQNGKTIKLGKIMALQELLEEDK